MITHRTPYIWPLQPLSGYKQLTESLLLMELLLHTTAASVEIVGTLNCPNVGEEDLVK